MIAYLQGTLCEINQDSVVILTGGVGYQVFVTKRILQSVPEIGAPFELKIHTVVREDHISLFGFKRSAEKELFLKLLQVSNIGPKLALNILSGLPVEELIEAIRREDLIRLTAISGIGKKTAERMIVELKDKIFGIQLDATDAKNLPGSSPLPISLTDEALSALMNLGYSRQEAQQALRGITIDREMPLEVLLREGLKALS